ncbi:cyclin-dependent protein kinase inhibitor SMR10-like [Cornus florida]|uniref:cyclin-dependent protein kinase inhibitor SMR10-like n=1 Tax=Cornus florida TaxID=4283 RepID=UPI0028A19BAD|nr:cyclin-dependent protein kinase inhibitor SMR10-like [Cornus florida]
MGLPNSGLFLSQSDLNAMEFNFLSKPMSEFQDFEFQIAPKEVSVQLQEQDQQQEDEQKQEQGALQKAEVGAVENQMYTVLSPHSSHILKRSSVGEFKEEDDDGFRTPTNLDQRIPILVPQCPPAPRKPKSLPVTKRSKAARRGILMELSKEIESLFPPALLADIGGKMKKARK